MAQKKTVLMLGQTGAGKSTLGNLLLEGPVFMQAETGSSSSMTKEISEGSKIFGDMRLTVADSPGLGDTNGKSIVYLNDIMGTIRRKEFHAILLVVNGAEKHGPAVRHALRCLRQCCRPSYGTDISLPQGRVFLVVNHVPSKAFGFGTNDVDEKKVVKDQQSFLNQMLEMSSGVGLERIFVVKENNVCETTINNLRQAIKELPEDPLSTKQFRTFSEVTKEADMLKTNAVSADDFAKQRIEILNYDINWHQKRIRDCKIAIASTFWVPFAGQVAGAGMAIAIADSENKIPGLEKELREVESNKKEKLEKARKTAVEWQKEMAALEISIAEKQR